MGQSKTVKGKPNGYRRLRQAGALKYALQDSVKIASESALLVRLETGTGTREALICDAYRTFLDTHRTNHRAPKSGKEILAWGAGGKEADYRRASAARKAPKRV
jgi:hypothetical protein